MAKKEKQGFILYYEDVSNLERTFTPEEVGTIILWLNEYALYGVVPDSDNKSLLFAFETLRGKIDRDTEKYNEKCKKNAYSAYCKACKEKGIEPKPFDDWETDIYKSNATERNRTLPTGTGTVTGTVTETETRTETVTETVKGMQGGTLRSPKADNWQPTGNQIDKLINEFRKAREEENMELCISLRRELEKHGVDMQSI